MVNRFVGPSGEHGQDGLAASADQANEDGVRCLPSVPWQSYNALDSGWNRGLIGSSAVLVYGESSGRILDTRQTFGVDRVAASSWSAPGVEPHLRLGFGARAKHTDHRGSEALDLIMSGERGHKARESMGTRTTCAHLSGSPGLPPSLIPAASG